MDGDKITLDRETFKALAVDSRVNILKILDERQHTLSDLAEELHMAPSTIKEHLDTLVAAGLIRQEDKGMKWKYYKLTYKGKQVVNPYETKVMIVLTASAIGMMVFAYTLYSKIKGLVMPDIVHSYAPQAVKSAVDRDVSEAGGAGVLQSNGGYGWTNAAGDTINNTVPMMPQTIDVAQDKMRLTSEGMNEAANTVVTTMSNVSTTLAAEMNKAYDSTANATSTALDAVTTTLAGALRHAPQPQPASLVEKAASTVYVEVVLFAVFALITGLCIGYLMKKKKMI